MEILLLLACALLCLIGIGICSVMRNVCNEAQVYGEHLIQESQKAQKEFNDALASIKKPVQSVSVDQLPQEVQVAVLSQATMDSAEFERFMERLRRPTDDTR
jgi:hypothetical protein